MLVRHGDACLMPAAADLDEGWPQYVQVDVSDRSARADHGFPPTARAARGSGRTRASTYRSRPSPASPRSSSMTRPEDGDRDRPDQRLRPLRRSRPRPRPRLRHAQGCERSGPSEVPAASTSASHPRPSEHGRRTELDCADDPRGKMPLTWAQRARPRRPPYARAFRDRAGSTRRTRIRRGPARVVERTGRTTNGRRHRPTTRAREVLQRSSTLASSVAPIRSCETWCSALFMYALNAVRSRQWRPSGLPTPAMPPTSSPWKPSKSSTRCARAWNASIRPWRARSHTQYKRIAHAHDQHPSAAAWCMRSTMLPAQWRHNGLAVRVIDTPFG